ncbi:MAG TPA: NUDIX domain-containing protein [Gemmatimonadaceae bacterium]
MHELNVEWSHMVQARKSVRTETQVSAGGAALRKGKGGLEVALISVGSPPRWQLPKGLVDKGETPEVAAVREVREEAGVVATIDQLIEKVEYWYQASRGGERIRYHKFVNFYLMWYESGAVEDHDNEVNESRWFPVAEAVSTLAFRSERSVLERAVQLAGA